MNAEELAFPDNTFDVVFGIGILHHLDIDRACETIARVLKPTGVAVFLEPLGHNPFINLARYLTPGSRTPDEHPLTMSDLGTIRQHFQTVELRFVNLLTLLSTPVPSPKIRGHVEAWLASADRAIFNTMPWFRRFAWNVVVTMRHPSVTSKCR
jgi:ubiquinone/menaquinone biosynthesis C-methylase UbiE